MSYLETKEQNTFKETANSHDFEPGELSLASLQGMLARRTHGVSGPERDGSVPVVKPEQVLGLLDYNVGEWSGAEFVSNAVTETLNKLIDREKIMPRLVGDLSFDIAATVNEIVPELGFPEEEIYLKAVARLVLNYDTKTAMRYVNEEFVGELQDIAEAKGLTDLREDIGNFFTLKEIMRRANFTRTPLEDTINSVRKSVEICSDKANYVEQVIGRKTDERFVGALTNRLVLYLTTRSSLSLDEKLERNEALYVKLADEYPLLAKHDSPLMVTELMKRKNIDKLLSDNFGHKEELLKRACNERPDDRELIDWIVRGSKKYSYDDLVAKANQQRALKLLYDRRLDNHNTPTQKVLRTLNSTSYLEAEDYNAIEHGKEYKSVLYELVQSPRFTEQEKEELFDRIRTIRQRTRRFAEQLKPALGSLSRSLYKGVDQRITEVMYTAKYFSEHGEESVVVPMGSKSVSVSVTPQEILRSLSFIESAVEELSLISLDDEASVDDKTNLEAGYVAGTNDRVLLLTKARRDDKETPLIRGRKARINFVVGMGGIVPSTIASEREESSLSIRMDLDDDQLMIDIGGKTGNPYTPDFIVAKCVSLGAWLRGTEKGIAGQDYHIGLGEMSEDAFEQMAKKVRNMAKLSPASLRIPHETP